MEHRPQREGRDANERGAVEQDPFIASDTVEHDVPVPYLERTRRYYQALGYGEPYRWAHHATVPFARLAAPLAHCTVGLVTTAAPYRAGAFATDGELAYQAKGKFHAVYSADTAHDPDLRITHVAIDFQHTHADDPNTWFPLPALRRAAAAGRIGAVAPRFHGMPTNRSQRRTLDVDVPELLERCRADAVHAVLLVANCPVCHQTLALAARALEANGIATVVMGCAKDIVERVGVARFLFSDFPLGNAAGRPHDTASQDATLALALDLLECAPAPRTTVQSPLTWASDPSWKLDYANVDRLTPEDIARRRRAFDRAKREAKANPTDGAHDDPRRGVGD
ncbi:MAG TPA: reductase [Caldimonas sp.]|nr:reductase [Caldimonas sp.]